MLQNDKRNPVLLGKNNFKKTFSTNFSGVFFHYEILTVCGQDFYFSRMYSKEFHFQSFI